MATLRVLSTTDPNLQGKRFPIDRDLRVGRDPAANDLVINESRASRRHARITPGAEGVVVTDEGSDNGVWINQTRVMRHVLRDGDQLGIGETIFAFENPPSEWQTVVAPAPPQVAQPKKPASGCAIGCLILSIVLFFATIAGSFFALYRAGYLPGMH